MFSLYLLNDSKNSPVKIICSTILLADYAYKMFVFQTAVTAYCK